MINTYQTSLAPPPVPPRLSRSQPILIPAPLPSKGHSKPLIRFLVGVLVVHLFLSLAAFLYLYLKHQKEESVRSGEKGLDSSRTSFQSSENLETFTKASARLKIGHNQTPPKTSSGHLEWDINQSVLKHINFYERSWLTILQPGQYYVYSSVTFSKSDRVHPLVSRVKLRKNQNGEESVEMQAFCNLDSDSSIPKMCTATQGGLITLNKGNQLSVWVHNLTLVDYLDASTTFGMYKL